MLLRMSTLFVRSLREDPADVVARPADVVAGLAPGWAG
jgi:hypothetical protein